MFDDIPLVFQGEYAESTEEADACPGPECSNNGAMPN